MRTITTYERFYRHLAAWVDGEVDSLLVVGRPGTGKTTGYRQALGAQRYHVFGGRQTPLQIYMALHDEPHLPVVLDDISGLLRDVNFVDMLKGLCDTSRQEIRWGTTTPRLEGRAQSFICNSPVLIMLNTIPQKNEDVSAFLDRCDVIEFHPTKIEVINRMRQLFPDDSDLIDLLQILPIMPTLRTLVKAQRWRRSRHLNLAEELLDECGVALPVRQLVKIMETMPESKWCSVYMTETGITDRTYRRHKLLAEQIIACREYTSVYPNVQKPDRCPSHATNHLRIALVGGQTDMQM